MKPLTLSITLLALAGGAQADTKMKLRYVSAGESTETTVSTQGARQRFEYPDMVVIQQPDRQRFLQLDPKAQAFTILPLTASAPAASTAAASPRKGGIIMVTTTTTLLNETKQILGLTARHVKTVTTQQPMPSACDTAQATIEIDGWYADLNESRVASSSNASPAGVAGCTDEYRTQATGDPNTAFPLAYTVTTREGTKTTTTSMEVLELSTAPLDAALFDAPAGWAQAKDASEYVRLQASAVAASAPPKKAGASRIGVMEFADKSGHAMNQDYLAAQLLHSLAGSGAEVLRVYDVAQARQAGCDYVLSGDILEVKHSAISQVAGQAAKVTGLLRGGLMRGAAAATTNTQSEDSVEAKLAYKLTPLDSSKPETTGTVSARSGAVISLKTAITLASNVTPMLMMAQMVSNPFAAQIMNTSILTQQSSMSLDPAMSGMNAWTRATSSLAASQSPAGPEGRAVNAAFDQMAKAVSAAAK